MKTCRFCMHEQESGDYCEACGSPFSADKLDFSGESMPDPTAGAFPDPTQSAFPDPTKSAFPDPAKSPDIPSPSKESAPGVVPVVAAGMPAPEERKPNRNEKQSDSSRKIMYSAHQNGETVYLKGKGNYLKKGSGPVNPEAFSPSLTEATDAPMEQQGAGWWNGASPSGANASGTSSSQPAPHGSAVSYSDPANGAKAAVPSWLSISGIVMIVASALGTVCLCGSGFIPLILTLIAYSKISAVKNGHSEDPDHDLTSAKVLLVVSLLVLILTSILMITTVIL